MEIKTKYALDAHLWVAAGKEPREIEVAAIIYGKSGVQYLDRYTNCAYYESQCFPTKEEVEQN